MHKKIMRRIIFLLATVLLLSCGSMVYAGTVDSSGTCGDGITWELDSEGVLTISGEGEMSSFDSAFRPYKIKKVIIEDGITSIVNNAFKGGYNITKVTIPDSVTEIGYAAFSDCSGLTSITIPDSVTEIGDYAFSDCSGLTSITIPDSMTEIGYYVFSGCSGLTSITIPDSVTKIGGHAFSGCSGLTSITIPDSVTSMKGDVFSLCSGLTSITIPDSVTEIGEFAFPVDPKLTIHGLANSYAHKYAKDYEISFKCISHQNIVTVPAVNATCTATGLTEGKTCKDCGTVTVPKAVIPALGHKAGELKVTVKATSTREGTKVNNCTTCNAVMETVIIKPAKITLSKVGVNYTGKKVKAPVVRVKTADGKVIPAKYYTVTKPKNVTKMKDIGRYTYIVKFKANCPEYKGTVKLHFEIKPAKTTIKAPKASKKAVTVKWTKGKKAQITGYDILLATDKKFTKNAKSVTVKGVSVTSKKVTKLKAKTKYYVKVRTYKIVKGVKIYSDWSKVKTCRTK